MDIAIVLFLLNVTLTLMLDIVLQARRTLKGYSLLLGLTTLFCVGIYYFPIVFSVIFTLGVIVFGLSLLDKERRRLTRISAKLHGVYRFEGEDDPDLDLVRSCLNKAFLDKFREQMNMLKQSSTENATEHKAD